ncbi:MAG: acetyl-CoA acetyltransferase [Gammaproteobacteria bacterium]|nr:acetyl-CoA acetyltransferase [Gammaproteobacteria bacterium]
MHDRTPILVGGGQYVEREVTPEMAQPPMGIAALAAQRALCDSGVANLIVEQLDALVAIRIFPDSWNRPRMPNPFGRAENPPRAIARRLGANPRLAIYGNVGGNTPQKYINEMAERIAEGDLDLVLLAGSEAIWTARRALKQNVHLDWQEEDVGSLEDRGIGEALSTPHEFAHGLGVPIQTYPLFENALRDDLGHNVDEHRQFMGKLFAPFTRVAARNPYAFYGTERNAGELATISSENRYICLPYPKWMNAMDSVNQGAAVLMTSVAKAREMSIDPSKWIFLHGCGEANEKLSVSERLNYTTSPALGLNASRALEMAGLNLAGIEYIDIYSCFPSAVEIACRELGVPLDDPRGLTLTGGLPFFGGPGNNYSMHAIASLLPLLRNNRKAFGMVTANGGYLSKHATGIYSARPYVGCWKREDPAICQQQVDALAYPCFTEVPTGAATIETYTVCYEKGIPTRGIVIGRQLNDKCRFVANTPDSKEFLQQFAVEEQLGRFGTVRQSGGLNLFEPDFV